MPIAVCRSDPARDAVDFASRLPLQLPLRRRRLSDHDVGQKDWETGQ